MIKVYYFDGSGGCERCQTATAYSFEPPERPHPYCDCPIMEDDIVLDDFEIEYRHLIVLEDYVEWKFQTIWLDCAEYDRDVHVEFEEIEERDISPGLEAFAKDEDWSPPDTQEEDLDAEAPANHAIYIEMTYERYTVDLLADVYAVGRIGDETFEAELEPEIGHYEKNVRLEWNAELTEC